MLLSLTKVLESVHSFRLLNMSDMRKAWSSNNLEPHLGDRIVLGRISFQDIVPVKHNLKIPCLEIQQLF